MSGSNPRHGTRLRVLPTATSDAESYIGQIVTVNDLNVDYMDDVVMVLAENGQRFPLCEDEWEILDD